MGSPDNGRFDRKSKAIDEALSGLGQPITEAEAQAYLGDLLLKSNRADAEAYLQRALALDPNLPMANASLGLLRVREGKPEQARAHLERAVAASSQNYLIHYYYAFALSREGMRDTNTVMGFAPEIAAKMRVSLNRAIELRPDFPESYNLLAFLNLVTATDIDLSVEMMKHQLAIAPARDDFAFMLAQLYLRKEDAPAARKLIDRITKSTDAEVRQRAQSLRSQLEWIEKDQARLAKQAEDANNSSSDRGRDVNGQAIVYDVDPNAILRDSLRKPAAGETQTQGVLLRIDCDPKAITFVVRIGDQLRKLTTDNFHHVALMTFTAEAGRQVTCGPRKPEDNVVVAYVPASDVRAKVDGVVKSVEFVPPDFKLKP